MFVFPIIVAGPIMDDGAPIMELPIMLDPIMLTGEDVGAAPGGVMARQHGKSAASKDGHSAGSMARILFSALAVAQVNVFCGLNNTVFPLFWANDFQPDEKLDGTFDRHELYPVSRTYRLAVTKPRGHGLHGCRPLSGTQHSSTLAALYCAQVWGGSIPCPLAAPNTIPRHGLHAENHN
jgi:hypothetical protein